VGLSADEKQLLEELTARAAEPDAEDDWELEIFDGTKGARIPISKGAKWLFDNFGIGDAPAPPAGDGDGGQDGGDGGAGGKAPAARQSLFAKRAAGQ
jgi:hypothetical protein